jgi:membrane-associated protease RseP (regulator of RpoE activity)
MLNSSETATNAMSAVSTGTPFIIVFILILAVGILVWGFNRAKPFGKLGILAWLQSLVLMSPWLIFFGLVAAGIYLNIIGILLLLVVSVAVYIYLGKQLRNLGQDVMLKEKAAQRLKALSQLESPNSDAIPGSTPENMAIIHEVLPIPEEDLALLKGIFSIDTFFATETISYQEGAIFKGNLRGDPDTVYPKLSEKLTAIFGEKYRLFLVEGTEGRPIVIILPSTNDPKPATLVQKNLALVLLLATLATSLEAIGLLLGFDLSVEWQRYPEALPLAVGLWAILAAHEIGHYLIAKRRQVRLSIPFFLPNWQIGSFGAVTRFESLLRDRATLFDISFAGPALGGLVSLVILFIGLVISHPGSLFQLPTQFFQGSILIGSLARVVLGEELQKAIVDISPMVALGWLGLVINALNLLPAGQLDGGRIVQAIYGRKIARRTTIATLVVLGVVSFINPANPIPLYWAVVILFLQRDLERPSLNELTEPDDARAAWGLLALFLMLATLIPLSPGLAGRLGIG